MADVSPGQFTDPEKWQGYESEPPIRVRPKEGLSLGEDVSIGQEFKKSLCRRGSWIAKKVLMSREK